MTQPKIEVYATQWCPYCNRARALLTAKGATFDVIDIEAVPGAREQMQTRSGRRTVPQIFVGDRHVGGCDDLMALDASGGLESLLKGETTG